MAPQYAFVVHLTSAEDLLACDPGLRALTPRELREFCAHAAMLPPGVLMQAPRVHSRTGAVAEGVIVVVPLLPEEMARRGAARVGREILRAVDLAASLGVRIVGLGGYTVPYTRRGLAATGRGPAITTGNVLTAGMALAATREVAARQGLAIQNAHVAVVGARGSVGALCARLLARDRPRHLVLVGNPTSDVGHLERLCAEVQRAGVPAMTTTDLARLADCEIVITATAAAQPVLDGAPLAPGTIVCDVARPPDTSPCVRARRDLTVIDGGLVALPDSGMRFGTGNLQNLPDGVTVACLAETILLALEGEERDCGVGPDVPVTEVDRLLGIAERHGFRLAMSAPALVEVPPANRGRGVPALAALAAPTGGRHAD